MDEPQPFFLHSERVRRDWIDYNGHMSEAFYLYAFGEKRAPVWGGQ